jgi:VWFA-related protein
MRAMTACAAVLIAATAVLPLSAAGGEIAAAPVTRTVYVTVRDGKGAPVTDLTAADFTVKEGGKDRQIVSAEPATARMQVSILVEERLLGDGNTRMGIFEFAKRIVESADVALITVGMRNETVVDYTGDLNTFVGALNKFTLNPNPSSNLTEGVLALARDLQQRKQERPVVVGLALSGGQAGGPSAENVLTQLRQSGASMHVVSLAVGGGTESLENMAEAAGREQVLGDGPKQSGGRRHEVGATSAIPRALQQVADDLLAQYAISYTLPDGVKPDRRLNVSVKRRGVNLRAPSAIPDR